MDVNEIRSDSDALMCTSCKKMLKIPVILPCGHTICKHHVDEAANNNETNHIRCDICLESYEIPANGFVRVRALEIQLENKPNLGQQLLSDFNLARDTCESFGEFLEEFNRIKSDPELKIHTVISDLKNKVDLKREEMKQEIDKKALTIIERLDEFERECKANLPLIESNCKLDEKLKSLRNDLEQTRKSSLTFEIFDKWRKIAEESKSAVKELQTELCKFNEHLFVGINCFNSIDLSISNILYPIRQFSSCLLYLLIYGFLYTCIFLE